MVSKSACKWLAAVVLAGLLFPMQARADYVVVSGGHSYTVTQNQNDGTSESIAVYPPDSAPYIGSEGAGPGPGEPQTAPDGSVTGQPAAQTQETVPAAQTQETAPAETQAAAQEAAQPAADASGLIASNGRTIDPSKPMVALTYDDGPQTSAGNRILDVFARYGQRCTFFLVGDRVPSRAAEVQRMVAEGHEVANHTYSHTYLNKVDAATIRSQVSRCNDVIEQTCGVRPTLMRLPGGNKNSTVLQNVNMPIILWNIDTLDWKTRNAQSTINAVVGHVKDGDIVLMHELYDATATATETIVPALVEQGFQLVTVSELAACRGKTLTPNTVYYSMR